MTKGETALEHELTLTNNFDLDGLRKGLDGIAKNAVRNAELDNKRAIGAQGMVTLLGEYFNHIGEKDLSDHFATSNPCLVRRVHVGLIGRHAIDLPKPVLTGMPRTQSMYASSGVSRGVVTCPLQPQAWHRIGFRRRGWTLERRVGRSSA